MRSPKTVTRYIEKPYDTSKLKIEYDGDQVIKSTVKKGTKVGTFKIYYDNKLIETFDATTSTDLHFSIWAYLKNNIFYYIGLIVIIVLIKLTLKSKPKKKRKKIRIYNLHLY